MKISTEPIGNVGSLASLCC